MAVVIQLRGDTSTNWTSVNPVLAERELGLETNTGLYKIGDGILSWNLLPYTALRQIDDATIINFENQNIPSSPAAGTLNVFARSLAGRMALRMQGPSGLSTPLQPSFFQNNIMMINTNATTTVTAIGNTVTSAGTISHPTPTALYGWMANFVTAATAAATAGTGNNGLLWVRDTSITNASGFFFNTRIALPDASYNENGASTGTRIFVGLTNQTMAASVGSNDPAGVRVGFQRLHVNGSTTDTNWFISVKGGGSEERINTGLTFTPECVYDCYLFCPPDGSFIGWRIDNITLGTTQAGTLVQNVNQLPTVGTYMRAGFQLQTVDAVARNIRMQRVYIESDR
jgi:hypothetical protein